MAPALVLFAAYVWVGLDNYYELTEDEQISGALINNVYWLVLYLLCPALGLGLALFLNQQVRGIRLAKSLFFFPFVINLVVVGLVYRWFYDPAYGPLNALIAAVGGERISILSEENTATFGIIFAGMWPQTAYCMIIYLAGLAGVDKEVIEAARIDGARGWRMFYHVVLPQLRPATFVVVVVTVVGALRSFDLVAIMTEGGPYGSSTVLAWEMYEQSLFNYRMGYGAAIAVLLFVIMDVYIAWFLWRLAKRER